MIAKYWSKSDIFEKSMIAICTMASASFISQQRWETATWVVITALWVIYHIKDKEVDES